MSLAMAIGPRFAQPRQLPDHAGSSELSSTGDNEVWAEDSRGPVGQGSSSDSLLNLVPREEDTVSAVGENGNWYLAQLDEDVTGKSEQKPYYKNLINLSLIDTDIRDALSALAIDQEINIATAKGVSGKISIHLFQVSLEKALHAITMAGGFSYHKYKGVYYVYKPKVTKDPQSDRLQMRIFELKYVEVDEIQEILDGIPGIRTVKIHRPSRTIIVEDTPESIKKIATIVRHWDTMPKQVMIEAKILEINLTDDMALGVEWDAILGDFRITTGSFSNSVLPDGAEVSPVPDTGGSGLFANVLTGSGNFQFAAALDALQTKTDVNTLSTPKVLAIHGETAKVQVGGQQGYSVSQTNLGVTSENIEFIDTGIVLEITPYIDNDNNVLLNVKPSVTSAELEEGIPVTRTAFVNTWLLAKSGDTVLIGGLIQDSRTKTRDEVPCLGNIPGLGLLFGRRARSVDKVELVILITPRVLAPGRERLDEKEAIEKTKRMEKIFKKEPPPPYKQIYEFLLPWEDVSDEANKSEEPAAQKGRSKPLVEERAEGK
jgi:type II secretory pathway component GspD/PulD (secretin)